MTIVTAPGEGRWNKRAVIFRIDFARLNEYHPDNPEVIVAPCGTAWERDASLGRVDALFGPREAIVPRPQSPHAAEVGADNPTFYRLPGD